MLSSSFLLFLFDYLHLKVPETFRSEKYVRQKYKELPPELSFTPHKKAADIPCFHIGYPQPVFSFYQITRLTATMER